MTDWRSRLASAHLEARHRMSRGIRRTPPVRVQQLIDRIRREQGLAPLYQGSERVT